VRISTDRPPNYDEIIKSFPLAAKQRSILFTYGDTIYNPDNVKLIPSLEAHEEIHSIRQQYFTPEKWWETYIEDVDFRLYEELLAHRKEYEAEHIYGRTHRRLMFKVIAKKLASPLYRFGISERQAANLLR